MNSTDYFDIEDDTPRGFVTMWIRTPAGEMVEYNHVTTDSWKIEGQFLVFEARDLLCPDIVYVPTTNVFSFTTVSE